MRPIRLGDVYALPAVPRFTVTYFHSWVTPTLVGGVGVLASGAAWEMTFTAAELRAPGVRLMSGGAGEALEEAGEEEQ